MFPDIEPSDLRVIIIPAPVFVNEGENFLFREFQHINQMLHKKGALVPFPTSSSDGS